MSLRNVATTVLLATLAACALPAPRTDAQAAGTSVPLFDRVSELDRDVFDAFNRCSAPDQLRKHAGFFAADVEFYHDTGGVTWNRQDMLANTEKYACGNYRRELIPGTLRVHPIKDFGALAQGAHRFCDVKSGKCEGAADFLVVWRNQGGNWSITRVLSYGHRPAS